MAFKQSPLYSILNNKCPSCHEGNFFETNNAYNLKKFATMNDRCPVCNEDFRREPGYYFGSTYVSYSMTVGLGLFLYIVLTELFNIEAFTFIILFSTLLLALLPLLYRWARIIWIHIFVSYKGK